MAQPTDATMRVALNRANTVSARVGRNGAPSGRAVELAQAFAAQLGQAPNFRWYNSAGAILAAADMDEWDIAFVAADPARAGRYHFTRPYLEFDATCAVPASSGFSSIAELNVPGVRIASVEASGYGLQLRRVIDRAEIIGCADEHASMALLASGGADAVAGTRPSLDEAAASERVGVRVLPDHYAVLGQAIATQRHRMELIAALTAFERKI